jgi:hypothetical protein
MTAEPWQALAQQQRKMPPTRIAQVGVKMTLMPLT